MNRLKQTLCRYSQALIVFLLLPTGAHAADCFGSSSSATPAAPQADLLRAYRYDFSTPIRLAVDASSSVYIVDAQKGEVVVRAADGRIVQHRRGLGRPGAIAVDDAGSVYLADLNAAEVTVFDINWQPIMQFGAGELQQPADMALNAAGDRLYLSDSEAHRILVFSTSGELLFDFGERGNGDGQFEYPSGIYVDTQNNEVLVADQLGFRVQVFDLDGTYQYCLGGSSANPGGFFQRGRLLSAPQGLWADQAGRIFVTDSFDGQVKVIDRNGRLLNRIGSFGSAVGELRQPADAVMDAFGRLYVASSNNARLEMYGVDAYSDPELFAPARVFSEVTAINAGDTGSFQIYFDVPGYHLDIIQQESIRLNGLTPQLIERTDFDRDGLAELGLAFDLADLLATLPGAGLVELILQGAMLQLGFEGKFSVEVIPLPIADADSDGVLDDIDLCPATDVDTIVDSKGCALTQYCRCGDFKHLRRYKKCIKRHAHAFEREGLMDRKQRKQAIKQAKKSSCAKQLKHHRRDDDDHQDDEHEEDEHDSGGAEEHDHQDDHGWNHHRKGRRYKR